MGLLDASAGGAAGMNNFTAQKIGTNNQYKIGKEIRDQSLPFLFEAEDQNLSGLVRYILPINPEVYRISHSTRAVATQTLGGVFEDNIGLGLPRITIQGTFGYLGTLNGGGGRHVIGVKQDGWEHYQELESVFLEFYKAFGTYNDKSEYTAIDTNKKLPELRFFNFTDKDHFTVQLNKFDILRNTQRRFLYQYDIQMTVLGRYTGKDDKRSVSYKDIADIEKLKYPTTIRTATNLQKLMSIYSNIMGTISNLQNMVKDITDIIDQANAAVTAFTNGITSLIKAPFSLIKKLISTVDTLQSNIRTIANLPHEITHELRQIKQSALALGFHKDKFKENIALTGLPAISVTELPEVITAPLVNKEVADTLGVVTMNNPENTMFTTTQETVYTGATTSQGVTDNDTIETLAKKMIGSATQWQEIAKLNKLEYPYIVKTVREKVSATTGTYTLAKTAAANSRIMVVTSATGASAGKYILIGSQILEIESVNVVDITVTAPLDAEYPAGTTFTLHNETLAVLLPGDKIQAPAAGATSSMLFDSDAAVHATRMYGTEEYVDAEGRQEADTGGDIAEVSGYDNLALQLQHRLSTMKGELAQVGHPEYGSLLPSFIGKTGTHLWYERARVEAEKTILDDPRVDKVTNMRFEADATTIYITADIIPMAQTSSQKINLVIN